MSGARIENRITLWGSRLSSRWRWLWQCDEEDRKTVGFRRTLYSLLVLLVGVLAWKAWTIQAGLTMKILLELLILTASVWAAIGLRLTARPSGFLWILLATLAEWFLLGLLFPGRVGWPMRPMTTYITFVTAAGMIWISFFYFPAVYPNKRVLIRAVPLWLTQICLVLTISVAYESFRQWYANEEGQKLLTTVITICASAGALSAGMFAATWAIHKEFVYGISHVVLLRDITMILRVILLMVPFLMVALLPLHLMQQTTSEAVADAYYLFDVLFEGSDVLQSVADTYIFPTAFFALAITDVFAILVSAFFPLLLSSRYLESRAAAALKNAMRDDRDNNTSRWQSYMDAAVKSAANGQSQTLEFVGDQLRHWIQANAGRQQEWIVNHPDSKERITNPYFRTMREQMLSISSWICLLLAQKDSSTYERRQVFTALLNPFVTVEMGQGRKIPSAEMSLMAVLLFHPLMPVMNSREEHPFFDHIFLEAITASLLSDEEKIRLLWLVVGMHLYEHTEDTVDKKYAEGLDAYIGKGHWLFKAYDGLKRLGDDQLPPFPEDFFQRDCEHWLQLLQ